jgi:hypothetical protein
MGSSYFVFIIVFMGGALAYTFWMKKRAAQAYEDARPAYVSFFQRTGYRYADIADQPPEAQANRSFEDAKKPPTTGDYELHYVRDFYGLRIHYRSSHGSRNEGTKTIFWRSNQWEAELTAPPRIPIHIADKQLDSTLKKVGELFSNTERVFNAKCSQRVQTGIAEVDSTCVVFGEDPNAVRALFAQTPALVPLLSGWAELDVAVVGNRAVFADPAQNNMQAAMGGMTGSMALGFDIGKRIELSIPVHDRIAELLATLVRAAS